MSLKHIMLTALLMGLYTAVGLADSVRISQVDSSGLLLKQQIKLYVSVTDDRGIPQKSLKQENFEILESVDGQSFQTVPKVKTFQEGINFTQGVNFLLLIDNSESMYWTLEGEKTSDESKRRMTIAKKAVQSFLKSIKNPNDKVGIAAYNSYYTLLSHPSSEIEGVKQQLDKITRPAGDEIYTEIYASLALAINEFDLVKGRKAVIILSDGVNNPAYPHTKKINEQFGTKFTAYQTPLDRLQLEGISLYAINFGKQADKKDRYLKTIALQSGGVVLDAHSQTQLNQVYATIMDQIQNEYVLAYHASMDPADKKHVRVTYRKEAQEESVSRTYLSSSVFGLPAKSFNVLYLLTLLLSVLLLWALSKIKFERQRRSPSIEVLNAGAGKLSTQVLTLGGEETVIGSSPQADMTIAGLPSIEENHATIVFDASSHRYSLKGKGKMLVNNQVVTTKVLEPGDLINIDGTTMVFDEGTDKEDKK